MTKFYRKKSSGKTAFEEMDEHLETLHGRLSAPETENIVKSWLRMMSDFHDYSFNNQMLLLFQARGRGTNISRVAPFRKWAKMKATDGRKVCVKAGEKAYRILFPIEYKLWEKDGRGNYVLDEKGEKKPVLDASGRQKTGLFFGVGPVFDISQTNAQELGIGGMDYRVVVPEVTLGLFYELKERVKGAYGVSVDIVESIPFASGARGAYMPNENRIAIVGGSHAPSEMVSSLFHELGHCSMHGELLKEGKLSYENMHKDRGMCEGEAEAFCFALSSMFGIDNKSELYISKWGNTPEDLRKVMGEISSGVKTAYAKLGLHEVLREKLAEQEEEKESNEVNAEEKIAI